MGISFLLIMNVTCNENYCLKFFGLWVHRANYFFADCFRVTCKKFDVFYCILAIRILGLSDRNTLNLMKKSVLFGVILFSCNVTCASAFLLPAVNCLACVDCLRRGVGFLRLQLCSEVAGRLTTLRLFHSLYFA